MALLSLTGKRWILAEDLQQSRESSIPLTSQQIVSSLARQRGIEKSESSNFIGLNAELFPEFPAVRERIRAAMEKKEKIGIFGDYDCDGITSAALMIRFFRRRGVEPRFRLPHRISEEYGLKEHHIKNFIEEGAQLLITVDTGGSSVEEIALAREAGIDVIVLDHHHLRPELPKTFALLHPNLIPNFTDSAPCAAGVAWSVVVGLERADGVVGWDDMATDLALAGIGTIADLVELKGSNRILVHESLRALAGIKEGPLAFLRVHAGMNGVCTSRDVAFRIAPRLNAAGRMADPHIALQALLGNNDALLHLEQLNQERQTHVGSLLEEALMSLPSTLPPLIALKNEAYSPGIVGLLASKLTEKFGRPTLIASIKDQHCIASLRSIPGYHITDGLARAQDLLVSFGGHAQAAGCAFSLDRFEALTDRLNVDVAERVTADDLFPSLTIDASLEANDVTLQLCEGIGALEPFGQGNPEPRFLVRSVRLEDVRRVGKEETHLQARVAGKKLIGFGMAEFEEATRQPLDLVCRVGIDTWGGSRRPQLFLDDLRIANTLEHAKAPNSSETLSFRS
ncbi:single-stranded-DNA-specific exonuclease RecJ [Candidatus Peregrinibacteria bacterium]|nr:single-stranded-DNA-specific exonuclease RecJ [Candidatus Peregrinibacteria bacterium]